MADSKNSKSIIGLYDSFLKRCSLTVTMPFSESERTSYTIIIEIALAVKGLLYINLVEPTQNLKIRKGGGGNIFGFAYLYIDLCS